MKKRKLPAPLTGMVPPIVTPLHSRDVLDVEGLGRLVERLITGGVSALFVLGTTGEGPALSYRLRRQMVERTCQFVNGRIPVLVGITDASLVEALEMARFAADAGADAIVSRRTILFSADPARAGALHQERAGRIATAAHALQHAGPHEGHFRSGNSAQAHGTGKSDWHQGQLWRHAVRASNSACGQSAEGFHRLTRTRNIDR